MQRRSLSTRLDPSEISTAAPLGALAIALLARWQAAGPRGLLYLCDSERRAERLGAVIHALAPETNVLVFPRWDVLPYDDVPPSRDVTGRRASVLRRLSERPARPFVLTTPDATLQRVPPRAAWADATLTLKPGRRLAAAALKHFLQRTGYDLVPRVEAPGEAALQGRVVDIYPAGGLGPVRLEQTNGRILSLEGFDLDTQRTTGPVAELVLDAASEIILRRPPRSPGAEPDAPSLARHYGALDTLFDYLPAATTVSDPQVDARAESWLEQVRDSYEARRRVSLSPARGRRRPPETPQRLFLDAHDWRARLKRRKTTRLPAAPLTPDRGVPRFATSATPRRSYRAFIEAQRRAGRRVLLAAADESERRTLERRAGPGVRRIEDFSAALTAKPGDVLSLRADMDTGFVLPSLALSVVTAADVLGSRAAQEAGFAFRDRRTPQGQAPLRPGSAIIHWDRGIGILHGLEKVSAKDAPDQDMLRVEYGGGTTVLVPVDELSAIWTYGADARRTALDRADGSSWTKRRAELAADIAATARHVVDTAHQRDHHNAIRLTPPQAGYERFAARFRHFPSPDQADAIEAVLTDLASGRAMDRLVCGDVGFGKTEVALRACAAAVLSGTQAAVAVPTTVLARQHAETFRKRFAGFGVTVAQLSRLTDAAEARAVKKGLADGSIALVIGTHAIAARDVRFRNLGLLVIDEEQRFGIEHKARLRALAEGVHTLTMTATPIPRTLRLASIGLRDMSVIATPPVRRLPIRTVVAPFADTLAATALRYEKRRGGQSFVVTPRIEDIPGLRERIAHAAPGLDIRTVHGQMAPEVVDETMVRFADGDGDVLLATSIIETGLDLPRANTILICGPERFGVAQLHQLRGRVGRGSRRAFAYLLTDGNVAGEEAARRLRALQENASLGAGFAISERDMELRGAGELLGTRQAGHLRLVGPELYRHLLERAVAEARGEAVSDDAPPDIHLDIPAGIPRGYIAEQEPRLELYYRLARAASEAELEDLGDEIEDRFGAVPEKLQNLLDITRLRLICRRLGIARIDAGPRAVALTFRSLARWRHASGLEGNDTVRWNGARMVLSRETAPAERIAVVSEFLARLEAAAARPPVKSRGTRRARGQRLAASAAE